MGMWKMLRATQVHRNIRQLEMKPAQGRDGEGTARANSWLRGGSQEPPSRGLRARVCRQAVGVPALPCNRVGNDVASFTAHVWPHSAKTGQCHAWRSAMFF